MSSLREEAFSAFRQGRTEEALALLTEVVRRTPLDHRARMAGAQCLARLGAEDRALTVLADTAESLAQRDFLLSATLAAKLGLALRPGEPRLVAALRRVHARAAANAGRGSIPPPLPPEPLVPLEVVDLCAHLRGQELLDRAFEVLSGADGGGAPASPDARPPLPLFAFLDPEAFVDLVPRMGLREVGHGEAVVREGEPGDSIFIIVAGRARVEQQVRGQTRTLASLPGGSLFGELALLTGGRRCASVVAEGETELFEIKAADLEQVSRRFPDVPKDIVRYAEKRVAANMLVTSCLFDNLPPAERGPVLEKLKPRFVAAGEKIISEEASAQGLFLVMAGELSVTKKNAAGEPVALNLLRDGDVFGEISLLTGGPASATVTAVRKSIIALLERPDVDQLLKTTPAVADYLKALAHGRLKAIADSMHPAEILDAEALIVHE